MDYASFVGKKGAAEWTVAPAMLAGAMKSGTVNVFSTPSMVALMENAAMELVQPFLPEGITTVGTMVEVRHLNPTPEGAPVRAEAEIVETDGRRFVFRVTAWDKAGLIGEGIHHRATVKAYSLEAKAAER